MSVTDLLSPIPFSPDPADGPDPSGPGAPPLPGWAALVMGGLGVLCIALALGLAAALATPAPEPSPAAPIELTPTAASLPTFGADPRPIPVDLLTRLEAAGEAPLATELALLLDAVGVGFGERSARLEPTLQSYVYRAAGRFEWSPDTFRVAVTAPAPALAAARSTLLEQLFADAVAAGQLAVDPSPGAHGLSLVLPTTE